MSLETAKRIVEPFLNIDGDLLDIKFYGGETLMAFNVIQPLVEWIEQNQWKRRYRFFGSTNGTLLTNDIKNWILQRPKSFVLGLSYDGLPSSQTKNRGNDNIDLDFFITTWPEQPIQMTINTDSVSQMSEGVKFLLKKGAKVHPNVAYEAEEWSKYYLVEYAKQLKDLIYFYNENPQYPIITQFIHDLSEYAERIDAPLLPVRMCGAGDGFILFNVDGKSYPCHILSPLVLEGEQLESICLDRLLDQTNDFADIRCNNCPFTSSCPTCLACNFLYRNSFSKRDSTHCEIMKIEVQAYIKKEVIRLKNKSSLTQKEMQEVQHISKLLKFFQT